MDIRPSSISPFDLYSCLGKVAAPVLIDVRRHEAYAGDTVMIIGSVYRKPEQTNQWLADLPGSRPIVAYCCHGREISQGVTKALREGGLRATFLEGGIAGWKEKGLPTRRIQKNAADDKWVTREHPKVDRIACPWLVSRFINPLAEFLYVPAADVLKIAKETGGIPYDIKNVEVGHHGDRCSFDAIVEHYDIRDPALDHMAAIVQGADTSRLDLTPQCEGLLAISYGLSANFPNDHEMLSNGLVMYDALYAWCRIEARKESRSKAIT